MDVILYKLLTYTGLGCLTEVLFTATSDLISPRFLGSWNVHSRPPFIKISPAWREKRDVRAVGYTFLWMFPVYACLLFLEPIHDLIREWPLPLRLFLYLIAFWGYEFCYGWCLRKITGKCPWDYSTARWSYKGFIRWDFAPFWLLFGLVFEFVHDKLNLLGRCL